MRRRLSYLFTALVLVACSADGAGDDASDTAADATSEPDTSPPATPVPLAACDGAASIYVERGSGERELVDWRGGDVILRGYAACDGDVDRFRVVSTCGGELTARLTWTDGATQLGLTLRADEVDGGTLSEGPVTVTLPLAEMADADASGDFALDVDIACVSGAATTWALDLDTASTAALQKEANGWPLDLLPDDWESCVDDRFPDFGELRDQYGNRDVTLGQFYGDMTVVAVSGVWCGPCLDAAAEAQELHDVIEAKSDEWGFTLLEVLVEDGSGKATFGPEAPAWAEDFGLLGPVLVGPGAQVTLQGCVASNAVPSVVILDPMLRVRQALTGAASIQNIGSHVEIAYNAFRLEHPEWVSPRCVGVGAAERVCPCDDIATWGDSDGDGISDTCDVCATDNDRNDYDGDGVPNACDDTPGESPIPQYREVGEVRITFEGVRNATGGLESAGGDAPSLTFGLYDELGGRLCGVSRKLPSGATAMTDLDDSVLMGWRLPTTNLDFAGALSCWGPLDPGVWGSPVGDAFEEIPTAVTFDDRCPVAGCEGRDDPVFGLAPQAYGCAGSASACAGQVVGASVWTDSQGRLSGPGGASYGVVRMFPVGANNAPDLSRPLDSATIRSELPEKVYFKADIFVPGSEVGGLLSDR